MSLIKLITFLLFFLEALALFGQAESNNQEVVLKISESDKEEYSASFGTIISLSNIQVKFKLAEIWQVSEENIFSNKPDFLNDSLFIDIESMNEFEGLSRFNDLLIGYIKRAYSFEVRDTFLSGYETVYVVKVGDESRLKAFANNDNRFSSMPPDFTLKYLLSVKNGFSLNLVKYGLSLVETKENDSLTKPIRIISEFSSEHDGLYNYVIPLNYSSENGELANFDSLLDLNQILWQYGLQIQKVTRPVIGKVVDFYDDSARDYPLPYRPKIGQ